MLLMPRIQRRQIERLKSSRSIRVFETERAKPVEREERPQFNERRAVRERRQQQEPVPQERRRQERRNARQSLRPEIRAMLENAGGRNAATVRRGGVYIDEDV